MSQDKEREAFEAWFFDRFMVPVSKDRDGRYLYLTDRNMWEAWQARAAIASQQAGKGEPLAHLWQHSETGQTRVVMPDQIVTMDANWFVVGPLFLASPPSREPLTEWDIRGKLARLKCWHRLTEQEADELVQLAMQGGIHSRGEGEKA